MAEWCQGVQAEGGAREWHRGEHKQHQELQAGEQVSGVRERECGWRGVRAASGSTGGGGG